MTALASTLDWILAVLFFGFGLFTVSRWMRTRRKPEFWVAATFGTLGALLLTAQLLPEDTSGFPWVMNVIISVLALIPYLLFRFTATFHRPARWLEWVAAILTTIAVLGSAFVGRIPEEDEPAGTAFGIYVVVIVVEWLFLSIATAVRLWRGGAGQATVTRRRMRTLSVGSMAIAIALVLSAVDTDTNQSLDVATDLFAIASVPLFLFGLTPPNIVLAFWRRNDEAAVRKAASGLLKADTSEQIAGSILPHLIDVVGASAASLSDEDGQIIGEVRRPGGTPSGATELHVPLQSADLRLEMGPYAPYFGPHSRSYAEAVGGLIGIALERVRLLERERESVAEVRAVNDTMRDFLLAASHDIRTPLAVIKGFSSTMVEYWSAIKDEDKQEYLRTIVRHTDQLTRLVDDMLTAARVDTQAIQVMPEEAVLSRLVEETVNDLNVSTPIDLRVPSSLVVRADVDHLRRIVRNYVMNALNYGEAPITVSAFPQENNVCLKVADAGDGVEPELIPKLFDRFTHGKKQGKMQASTGLGLSIVRGLARANGGDAWYEENIPKGACFGVTIPSADN